jgi:diguanylate cyclase (GGDEF)-like protein/PAS domain S-box-containing protein
MSRVRGSESEPRRGREPPVRLKDRKASERELAEHAATNEVLLRRIAARDRRDCDRSAAEQDLHDAQARFETAFTDAPIGMALVAVDGRCLQVNDALCRIVGRTRKELEETALEAITHPDDAGCDGSARDELIRGTIPSYQIEKRFRHAFGHYLWVLVTVSLVRDPLGEPLHLVKQVLDISERKARSARLEYLIDHDYLTGLINRRRFLQEVAREAERRSRYGAEGAVLMIDLDNFKAVNDTFGHKAGDDLLRGVAGALRHRMRQSDVLARVGGDEFAMLLPETDAAQAQLVAEGISKTLAGQVAVLGERTIQVTASVGVALFDDLRASEVLEFADLAMYEAKDAGRNRVTVHRSDSGHLDHVSQRSEVELIRTALAESRMLLYCQPIVTLKDDEVRRYELLLRLRTGSGAAPLSPSSFLYVAERFNLIQEIDCWVAREAIERIAEYGRAGVRLVLHVNLSAKSIGDPSVAAVIEDAISDAGIDPACLVFELTETTAITNVEDVKSFCRRLRARGCRFALDDFGAGFGSFYHLKSLPFDYLKIDGDFIRGLVASPTDQLVVEAIVGIARGLGKETIAEFVPDGDTTRRLAASGVDYAQGYYVGRPRPLREVLPAR